MASADDNAAQLPAGPGCLTPPSRVVTRGAFRGIPCREGPGRLVSRDELKQLVEHGRAPHPVHNPAQPGRITARNATSDEETGKQYFKFRLNFIGYHLFLRSTADCRRRNVQAHLMIMRKIRGTLLQSTLPIKEAQWIQLVRGSFEGGDSMAAMCIYRMERKGAAAGPPAICWAHVQGLGRG